MAENKEKREIKWNAEFDREGDRKKREWERQKREKEDEKRTEVASYYSTFHKFYY